MVSIVIPIFNVEAELKRCLDSVTAQSYGDWEAILVNDGSTDDSARIAQQQCELSSHFRYIEQPNSGVAVARKRGVEAARGEYILFVDSDDALPVSAVENLVEAMEPTVDIVLSGYTLHTPKRSWAKNITPVRLNQQQWIQALLLDRVGHEPWAKIFRRSLFGEGSFPQLKRGQDWLSNIEVATRVRGVKFIPDLCYNYYHRSSSSMRSNTYDLSFERELCDMAERVLRKCGVYEKYRSEHDRMSLNQIFIALAKGRDVRLSDEWVAQVYSATSDMKLSMRERVARACIGSLVLQRALQYVARIYRSI